MSKLTRRRFVGAALAGTGVAAGAWRSVATAQESLVPPAIAMQPQMLLPPVNATSGAGLQPGARLVWLGASASIPGERSQIVPDPNGQWVNQRTGQRYQQLETPGPAGAGYTVADVLGNGNGGVLSWLTSLLVHTDQGNVTSFIDANGSVSATQNIGDFWVPPAQLAPFADRNDAGLRVLHMPYQLGGRTYRALRVQSESGGGWSQNTYDLDTGLLLVGSSTTQGSPTVVLDPYNRPTAGAGSTLLSYTQIAGSRSTSLPGPGLVYPNTMRQLRTLTYSGTRGVVMAGTGIQVPPTPIQIRYDLVSNAGPYLNARMTISGMPGGSSFQERIFPAGVIGSLWMDPDLLARYGANQTIDQDPVTGVQAVVLGRQNNIVDVALQTRLARQSFGYDLRNGLLARAELRQQIGPATDILAAQLVGTQ
jgi:hypothetical protein